MNKKPTSAKAPRKRAKKDKVFTVSELNASEILVSFFGFLTTRDQPITVSSYHDAAPIAELAKEFMNFHNFPKSRSNRLLVTPPFLGENIKMPQTESKGVARSYSPEELAHNVLDTIFSTGVEGQNKILRLVLAKVRDGRSAAEARFSTQIDDAQQNYQSAKEATEALELILSGKLDNLSIS